jgi:hypothetical protein
MDRHDEGYNAFRKYATAPKRNEVWTRLMNAQDQDLYTLKRKVQPRTYHKDTEAK